ncbi:MAG: Gp49 family protein [Fibrobacteria bacterium]
MSNDKEIEAEIVAKGLTAPRVTLDHVNSVIAAEKFIRATDVLTICVLTLRNGFTVTGESACASPENFNEEVGNKIAKGNAVAKIWALEGYLLKQKLFGATQTPAAVAGE